MYPIKASSFSSLVRPLGASLLLAVLPATGFAQNVSHNPDPLANNPGLPDLVRGPQAVQRLGDQLAVLASKSGMTTEEFKEHVLSDEGLFVNTKQEVIFVDPYFVDGDADEDTNQQFRDAPTIPLSQAFLLHSRPGSNYTIYLDFTGHRSVNNGWGHDITFPPFNRSGSSSSFSNSELQEIINNWRYIAEDFAAFDVNVTTEEPPLDMLMRNGGSDTTWGVRDIHTQATDGFGNGIGGIAGLFTFNSSQDRPVFSFNKGSNNGGMTGSHEVGHSLGLSHDGLNGSTYHPGQSLGSFTWGPIMGAPFGAEVVQWSNGDYANSTSTQNDVFIISLSSNGTSVLPDDHGDTIATATTITGDCPTPNQAEICSLITTRDDLDAYKFTSSGGTVSITVDPIDLVGDVDIKVELYDPNGVKLVGSNPTRDQSAQIVRTIGAGDYTIIIDGAQQANLYSDYGSLGHYILDVTFPGPSSHFSDLGGGLAGTAGIPSLVGSGFSCAGTPVSVAVSGANPNSLTFLAFGPNRADTPLLGGILVPDTGAGGGFLMQTTDGSGAASLSDMFPAGMGSGATFYFQYWVKDTGAVQNWQASNAIVVTVP